MPSSASIRTLLRVACDKPVNSKLILEVEGAFYEVKTVECMEGPAVILHSMPIGHLSQRPRQRSLFDFKVTKGDNEEC